MSTVNRMFLADGRIHSIVTVEGQDGVRATVTSRRASPSPRSTPGNSSQPLRIPM
jgi:hypothetical protein